MDDVDRWVALLDPVRGADLDRATDGPEAIALLRSILAQPEDERDLPGGPRPRRRSGSIRRASVAVAVLVLVVATLARFRPVAPKPSQGSLPVHLVAFTTNGPDIVARIIHPRAAAADLSTVFAAHGLDIHVETLPVSPSLVGSIVYSDVDEIRSLQAGRCLAGGTECVVGLVIPSDFSGSANVAVGRTGSGSEPYASSADVFGPGEAFHCSGALGAPTAIAAGVARSSGVTVQWELGGGSRSSVPEGYVVSGTALSASEVLLDVVPEPLDTPQFLTYEDEANRGCP